jgi:hypothetical protein
LDERSDRSESADAAQAARERRTANLVLLLLLALIVGGGYWLIDALIAQRAIDNCVAQGRGNCAPIDPPAR